MCKKEECIKKINDIKSYVKKEPVISVAVAACVGFTLGFLISYTISRK